MATHSSILAWRIPWTEEPGGPGGPWGHKELDMTERRTLSLSFWVFHVNGLIQYRAIVSVFLLSVMFSRFI